MLYAPLVKTPEEVAEVVRVAGKLPVNVLAGWPGFTNASSRISASSGSASAERSPAPPGAGSCGPRRTLRERPV